MRRVLLVLLVLVALALAADQGARLLLEHRVTARLAGTGLAVERVHVTGWPVLPRLATRGLEVSVSTEVPYAALPALSGGADLTWTGENGLLVAQVGTDGPRLANEVATDAGVLMVTPVSVQLGGLQVPVGVLGDRADALLGAALEPHRIDPAAFALPDGARFTDAEVGDTGLLLTLTAPLDRVP